MVDEHFRELIVPGPDSFQRPVITTHPTVGAILATKIGHLDHPPHKNGPPKPFPGDDRGLVMQRRLPVPERRQICCRWKTHCVQHTVI